MRQRPRLVVVGVRQAHVPLLMRQKHHLAEASELSIGKALLDDSQAAGGDNARDHAVARENAFGKIFGHSLVHPGWDLSARDGVDKLMESLVLHDLLRTKPDPAFGGRQ